MEKSRAMAGFPQPKEAVLKGIGDDGVHTGGSNLTFEDVESVIHQSEEFSLNWGEWVHEFSFPQKNGFYLFEKDPKTGLNTDVPVHERSHPRKAIGHMIMRFFRQTLRQRYRFLGPHP